ncbi:MAG: ubiquinone/menaquinone biosynthesis protein, partial [Alteromonadaceae bacterium]
GCGVGDVSMLAADAVGSHGSVVGIDHSDSAIKIARQRVRVGNLPNITFEEHNLNHLDLDEQFDAVVGRMILSELSDPAQSLRRLVRLVRPGGLLIFQEADLGSGQAFPQCSLFEQYQRWLVEASTVLNVDVDMGSKLYSTFCKAGLSEPNLSCESEVIAGAMSKGYEWLVENIRSLAPVILERGIASEEMLNLDTLGDRLRDEVLTQGSVLHTQRYVGAWARK